MTCVIPPVITGSRDHSENNIYFPTWRVAQTLVVSNTFDYPVSKHSESGQLLVRGFERTKIPTGGSLAMEPICPGAGGGH